MKKPRTLIYEHKCRKCSTITEMYFGTIENGLTWLSFANQMSDMVTNPRCELCDLCKRHTVRDVISYSGPYNL
jgi:hypothetical protein